MHKIKLFHNKAPLYKLNYRSESTNIFMLRDDVLDYSLGGNKVRMAEYIGGLILNHGYKKIITFGSIYSNHIRIMSSLAETLKIKCDIIILYQSERISPNIKLASLNKNTKIVYCHESQAHEFIDEYLAKEQGVSDYLWIPGGGYLPEAAFGYVDVANFILEKSIRFSFDAVFAPCGTGTTLSGLIYGLKGKIPVVGLSVARASNLCEQKINGLLSLMRERERERERESRL